MERNGKRWQGRAAWEGKIREGSEGKQNKGWQGEGGRRKGGNGRVGRKGEGREYKNEPVVCSVSNFCLITVTNKLLVHTAYRHATYEYAVGTS